MKKHSEETQTLRAGCTIVRRSQKFRSAIIFQKLWPKIHNFPKNFRHNFPKIFRQKFRSVPRPLPGGAGRPKFNKLKMVTTFTYKPSLSIDARNFELWS